MSRSIKHSLAATLTLKKYCNLQLKSNAKELHVPSTLEIILDIDQVYIPLVLEHQGSRQTYTHMDLLTVGNRIRVIGDPGSGKSSLVKRLLRDTCRIAIKRPSKSRLPILFELKNLDIPDRMSTNELRSWFYNELKIRAAKTAVYKMEECFDNYAKTTGLLVWCPVNN